MNTDVWDISRQEKITRFVEDTGASEEEARDYLEAEEWILFEAVYSWKADRGYFGR